MEIKKTANLSMFKKHPFNVSLDMYHVDIIVESLRQHNALEYKPILVNGDYEVIDGQHRLEAARKLGLEIYYQVDPMADHMHMGRLNKASRTWKIEHWIEHHALQGKEDYINLIKVKTLFNCSLTNVFSHLGITMRGREESKNIMAGGYKHPDKEYVDRCLEAYEFYMKCLVLMKQRFASAQVRFMYNRVFVYCFTTFMLTDGVCKETFYHKLSLKPNMLYQAVGVGTYFTMLENLYNYHNREKIELPARKGKAAQHSED